MEYIIEKAIDNNVDNGAKVLKDEHGNALTFKSTQEARQWLMANDKEFWIIPIVLLTRYYNIKPMSN